MEPEPHSPSNSRRARLNVPPLVDSWTGYRSKMETPTPTTGDFRSPSTFSRVGVASHDSRSTGGFSDVELDMAKFLTGLKGLHSGRSSTAATPYAVSRVGTPPTPAFTSDFQASARNANATSAINQSLSELSVDRQPASLRRRVDSSEHYHDSDLAPHTSLPRVSSTDAIRNRHSRTDSIESRHNTSPSQISANNANKRRRINAKGTQSTTSTPLTTRPRTKSNLSQRSDVHDSLQATPSTSRLPEIPEQSTAMQPRHDAMHPHNEKNFLTAARTQHGLAYCVSWLGWAQGHLHRIDTTLDGIIAEYEREDSHRRLPSGAYLPSGFHNPSQTPSLSNSITSTPSVIAMSDRTLQQISILRAECLSTMHKAMDIVSKSAGGSLPENARETVKKVLVELPARFDLAAGGSLRSRAMPSSAPNASYPENATPGGPQERDMNDPDITPPATRQAENMDGDVEMADETWTERRVRPLQTATESALDVAHGVSILTKEGMEMFSKVSVILGQAMTVAEQQQGHHISPTKTRPMVKATSPGRQLPHEVSIPGPAPPLLANPILQAPLPQAPSLAIPTPILPAPLPIVQQQAYSPSTTISVKPELQESISTSGTSQQYQKTPRRASTSTNSFQIPGETLASNAPLVKTSTQKEETPAVLLPSASMSSSSHKLQTFDPFTKEIIDHADRSPVVEIAGQETIQAEHTKTQEAMDEDTRRQLPDSNRELNDRELAARTEEDRNAQLAMHIHQQQQVTSAHAQIHHHHQAAAAHLRRMEIQAHVNSALDHQQQELDSRDNRLPPGSDTPPGIFSQTMPIRLLPPPMMLQGSVSNEVLPSIEVQAPVQRTQAQQQMQYSAPQFEFAQQGPRLAAEDMLMHGHLYGSVPQRDKEQREREYLDTSNMHASHTHTQARTGNVLPPISFLERIANLHEVEHGENYAMRYIDEMSGYPRPGAALPPVPGPAPPQHGISASRLTAEDMLMHGVRRDERPAHPYGGQAHSHSGYGFGHGHGFGPRL